MFRKVVYCSGVYMLFRGVLCCSGGLYADQVGYKDVQEGYILKEIIMFIVATNVIASQQPKCRPTGTQTARANAQ